MNQDNNNMGLLIATGQLIDANNGIRNAMLQIGDYDEPLLEVAHGRRR